MSTPAIIAIILAAFALGIAAGIALCVLSSNPPVAGSSPAGGASFNGRNAQVDARIAGAGLYRLPLGKTYYQVTDRPRSRIDAVVGGKTGRRNTPTALKPEIDAGPSTFNADRLTFIGLKNEIDPASRVAGQGLTAHPGGRRLFIYQPRCICRASAGPRPALAGQLYPQ